MQIAVIGTGRVAAAHMEAVKNLPSEASLYAVCDADAARAENAAREWGAEKVYTDIDACLKDPRVESVIICLPNHLHCETALKAAAAGKNILVEKPMAMNVSEADRMISAADTAKVTLMVGQCRRFSHAAEAMFKRIPEIGPIFRIDSSFLVKFPVPATNWWTNRDSAGPLVILLQGSHSLDTIVWLMGENPTEVFSRSARINPLFQSEDENDIILSFEGGKIATVHLSLNTKPYLHEILIAGEKGTLRLFEQPTEKTYGFSYRLEVNGKVVLEGEQVPSLYTLQLKEFIDAVRNKRLPRAEGREIRNTMKVLDAVCESDRTGRPVVLPRQEAENSAVPSPAAAYFCQYPAPLIRTTPAKPASSSFVSTAGAVQGCPPRERSSR